MYIFYDPKTDYLEVVEKKCANYSDLLKRDIFEIHAERGDKIIGHGIQNASKIIDDLDLFDPYVKFSILIKMARLKHGYTQMQVAKMMNVALLPYQRLESGKNNPTLKTILKIKEIFPEIDLHQVA